MIPRGIDVQAIQSALFFTLTRALPALTIYDYVPENARFPYLVIGEDDSIDWSDKTNAGLSSEFTLQVFSRSEGFREARGIANDVIKALTTGRLVIDGQRQVTGKFLGCTSFSDGKDRRVVIRYETKVQEV